MAQAASEHEGPLQADDAVSLSHDSALAASHESGSYLTSLNSSVLNYKYENGRRYHAFREGAYLVPNDDKEQDRMDLGHHIYRLVLGGNLFLAPIGDKVKRVLDLGTGTGIWAMDFAE
ncbi:demethylmenaquinone methyltransferase [Fusarium circinatum]|uniref:Demethylmenaquinone methyltransferase n=1 Tax=Fusarium circinatum TaxID=48490 RepID=A0A8H5WXZ0_FUSCI|nr:demethylmenaquinone methyltransferase [Fusarium circinatum]